MPRIVPQEDQDVDMTVTLPAFAWRRILYAVENHADSRERAGQVLVGRAYRHIGTLLAAELDVSYSGDLPVKNITP